MYRYLIDQKLFATVKTLKFSDGKRAEFPIYRHDDVLELCDDGIAKSRLMSKFKYGQKKIIKTLKKLTNSEFVRVDNEGKLYIDVSDICSISAMYYYFYWFIENLA